MAFISPVSTSITSISPILPPTIQTHYTDTENPMWGWNQCCHHLQTIKAAQRWVSHGRGVILPPESDIEGPGCCGCRFLLLLFTCSICLFCGRWTMTAYNYSSGSSKSKINFYRMKSHIFKNVVQSLNLIQCLGAVYKSDWSQSQVFSEVHVSRSVLPAHYFLTQVYGESELWIRHLSDLIRCEP